MKTPDTPTGPQRVTVNLRPKVAAQLAELMATHEADMTTVINQAVKLLAYVDSGDRHVVGPDGVKERVVIL